MVCILKGLIWSVTVHNLFAQAITANNRLSSRRHEKARFFMTMMNMQSSATTKPPPTPSTSRQQQSQHNNSSNSASLSSPPIRKFRRSRDAAAASTTSTTTTLSGFDLYELQGNAPAAFRALYGGSYHNHNRNDDDKNNKRKKQPGEERQRSTIAYQYNRLVLKSLVASTQSSSSSEPKQSLNESISGGRAQAKEGSSDPADLLSQLETFAIEHNSKMESLTARKRKRNELIMAYNRALILFTQGKYRQSKQLCYQQLQPWMTDRRAHIQTATKAPGEVATRAPTTLLPPPTLPLEIAKVAARLTFVWLEALLATTEAHHHQQPGGSSRKDAAGSGTGKHNYSHQNISADDIFTWLDGLGLEHKNAEFKFLLSLYKARVDLAARTTTTSSSATRSHNNNPQALHDEGRIRSARKELKTAMEVFQHKLRFSSSSTLPNSVTNNTGHHSSTASNNNNHHPNTSQSSHNVPDNVSVNSSVDSKERPLHEFTNEGSGTSLEVPPAAPTGTTSQQQQHQHSSQQSIVVQKLHQSALNLKANLEQLKGNVKKSLILCQEAHSLDTTTTATAGDDNSDNNHQESSSSSYYNAIHANNLAVIYQTSHKRHLALHVLSKTLQQQEQQQRQRQEQQLTSLPLFSTDGTAAPVQTLYTIWNAALCALQARNYRASYECWATCLRITMTTTTTTTTSGRDHNGTGNRGSGNEPFDQCTLWLRLAEACLGMHQELKASCEGGGETTHFYQTTPIRVNG